MTGSADTAKTLLRFGFAALLISIFVGLFAYRYRSGQNFLPVHVRLTSSNTALSDVVVESRSVFGSICTLRRNEESPEWWGFGESISSMDALRVSFTDSVDVSDVEVNCRVGEHHVEPFWRVELQKMPSHEFSDRPLSRTSIAFRAAPISQSLFETPSKAANWAGDHWLVLIPLLQTFFIATVTGMTLRAVQRFAKSWDYSANQAWFAKYASGAAFVGASVLFLPTIFNDLAALFEVRFPKQFALLFIGASAACISIWATCRWSLISGESIRPAFFTLGGIIVLKMIWILNVQTIQFSDYDLYWKIGKEMARGDWTTYAGVQGPLQTILVERSLLYFYPVALLTGGSSQGLYCFNVITQLGTLILFWVFVRRASSTPVATVAALLLTLHPDSWFSTTVACHDIPGFFWISVILCTGQLLLDSSLSQRRWLQIILVSAAIGAMNGILDIQRGFGPFIFLGMALTVAWNWITAHRTLPYSLAGATCLLVTLFTWQFTAKQIRTELASRVGAMGSTSLTAYATSADSNTTAIWNEMQPWRFLYFPALNEQSRADVAFRKLLYEKLEKHADFRSHIYRKNDTFTGSGTMVLRAFAGRPDKWEADADIVRFMWLKMRSSELLEATLRTLLLLGLAFPRKLYDRPRELFLWLFSAGMYAVLLTVTESSPIYDAVLMFLLAMVGAHGCIRLASGEKAAPQSVREWFPRLTIKFIWGTVVIMVLCIVHIGIGEAVAASGRTFLRRVNADELADRSADWTICGTVSLPTDSQNGIRAGVKSAEKFVFGRRNSSATGIRFALTGGQRLYGITRVLDEWNDIPVEYSVVVGGHSVKSGRLSDLTKPEWLEIEVANAETLEFHLSLEAIEDFDASGLPALPTVAVEYPHEIRASP